MYHVKRQHLIATTEGVDLFDTNIEMVKFTLETRNENKAYTLCYAHGTVVENGKQYIPVLLDDANGNSYFSGIAIVEEGAITRENAPLPLSGIKRPIAVTKDHLTQEAWEIYKPQIRRAKTTGVIGVLSISAAVVGIIKVTKHLRE